MDQNKVEEKKNAILVCGNTGLHVISRNLACGILLAMLLLGACKKSSNSSKGITFELLNETPVNTITGFAVNGDPLCRDATAQPIRFRSATKDFGRLGSFSGLASAYILSPRCEDASGNLYGDVVNNGAWWLPAGTSVWVRFSIPDPDTEAAAGVITPYPVANNMGDVVMQTNRIKNGISHLRLYRKAAGSTTWTIANDRTLDSYDIAALSDNGDVFLVDRQHIGTPLVLKAGSTTMAQIVDCAGATILPYCQFPIYANSHGDVLFCQGGLGSVHMYTVKSASGYPATAALLFDRPTNTASAFSGGYLPDGTVVTRMNPGNYDPFWLYIRGSGEGSWRKAKIPNDDIEHSADIMINLKGEVFTFSIPLGNMSGTGLLYKVNF